MSIQLFLCLSIKLCIPSVVLLKSPPQGDSDRYHNVYFKRKVRNILHLFYRILFIIWNHGISGTPKLICGQYVIFIQPANFATANIKCITVNRDNPAPCPHQNRNNNEHFRVSVCMLVRPTVGKEMEMKE